MIYRMPDADFNLRYVSDKEIFQAIKDDVVRVIKSFNGYENITSESVELNSEYTTRRDAFGEDKNLYHHLTLDIGVKTCGSYDSFIVFLNPFEVKLFPRKYDPEVVKDEELTNSFCGFMIKKFPNSGYVNKRKEYFEKARIMQKIQEELLFF